MRRFGLFTSSLLWFCAIATAGPVAHVLDTTNYNFQLDNGGGGAQAKLDKSQNLEIFCVDYANDIYVPASGYSAYLTTITSTSDLSFTRFGDVTSWSTIAAGGALTSAEATLINNVSGNGSALGRYQMAAYLVSTYNLGGGNSPTNNGIQQAIWDLLDPKTFSLFNTAAADSALASAITWYNNNSATARDSLMANFRIVSDVTMTPCRTSSLLCGGFQEQITVVPEPRHIALMLMGLLVVGSTVFRKLRTARSDA